jgi:signal transduction histidine kinase
VKLFPLQRTSAEANFFSLLLYLEWILLGIAVLTELVPNPIIRFSSSPAMTILLVAVLGLMGLRLPIHSNAISKILYTALEFGLLLLPTVFSGGSIRLFPLLYMVVVIRSCSMFQPRGRLVVAGLALSCFVLTTFQIHGMPELRRPMPYQTDGITLFTLRLHGTLTFGLALMFVLLLVNALLMERKIREKLVAANEQLRHYALRIENQATLQERNRIAREIHDSLGHLLTAQSIQLENALLFLPPEAAKTEAFLTEARQLGSSALHEVRQSVATLRSDPLQGKSLERAIAHIVKSFQQTTGIMPEMTIDVRSPLPGDVSTALYRILQEALTNIAKHADATHVAIELWEKTDGIHLRVKDDGYGFCPDQNTTGFGLKGMRERTIVLGGHFTITSQPRTGCQMAAVIPLSRPSL